MTQKPNRKSRPDVAPSKTDSGWWDFVKTNKGWFAGAAALVGSALFNQISARRAEAANPPAGKFVEIDGIKLHYVDRGAGPVVVLLHGNGVMLQDFEASGVLALAAKHHRVIAFDRPGFGYSERPRTTLWTPAAQADLIARALDLLGVQRAVVAGHSWGTLVALAMALDHPKVVSGLLLLSGYYYGTARPDVLPASVPAIPLLGDILAYTVSPLSGRLIGPPAIIASFAPAPVSKKIAALPVSMILRPSQIHATAADTALMIPGAIALSKRYGELVLPITILAGAGDLIAHVDKHAEHLAAALPQAMLEIFPGEGHLFHYDLPEKVVLAINELTKE